MDEVTNINKHDNPVEARAALAKLDKDSFMQPVQLMQFNANASDQDVLLLQLEKELLPQLEAGQKFVIRGNADDAAVLCTDNATYDLKKNMSSNTMICLEKCITSTEEMFGYDQNESTQTETIERKANAWSFSFFELKKIFPKVSRLLKLLKRCPYKGPGIEQEASVADMLSLSEMLDVVQCSEEECLQYLVKMNCCCIQGRWRLIDFGYIVECMGEILQVIDSESWNCSQVPISDLCEIINDSGELVPSFIVEHLLMSFGTFYERSGVQYAKLDEEKVSRFFVEMLLKDVEKFNLSEFLEVWKDSLPVGMQTNEKHLLGLTVTDTLVQPSSIKLMKSDDLPINIEQRFEALFKAKEKWTFEEISPYISDVCLKGQSVTSVLAKHARTSSAKNGKKMFSSRKSLT